MTVSAILIGVATAVAAGAGAVVRHLVGRALDTDFPLGTLVVNVVASFVLGLVTAAGDPLPTIVGIGALGAMSTWSTAANQAATMARSDEPVLGLAYLTLSASTAILAAWFGLRLGPVLF